MSSIANATLWVDGRVRELILVNGYSHAEQSFLADEIYRMPAVLAVGVEKRNPELEHAV